MIFFALRFLFLLVLIGITFVASFDLEQQAGELFSSFGGIDGPSHDLASEPQHNEGNNGFELITGSNPTLTMEEKYSELTIFQSGIHKCPYNPNQPYSRRARLIRREICVPSHDDYGPPVQDSAPAEPEEEKPQESARPDNSPVDQKPLAPYKDKLLCPIPLAPWPVCATVDSFYIHHQIIYPVMNAPIGWWIHEYCVPAPRFPNVCNKFAREVVWCCVAVFPYLENPPWPGIEPYPALRLIYPNVGYGCVPIEAL